MVIRHGPGVALLYHDIVSRDAAGESGIVTEGSWRYKIPPGTFRAHLDQIVSSPYQVTTLPNLDMDRPLLLTFDDGGVSCATVAAPILEKQDMHGHFFVITGRLGNEGYMTRQQVRALADAGHHIGSHTVTHPNLRKLSGAERRRELLESKWTIEDLVGATCKSVSIPGGFADKAVVADAFDIGYEYVFVSEPRYLSMRAKDRFLGRWNVWHNTTAADLDLILGGALRTRLRIQGRWYALKTLKRLIGQERFEKIRSPFVSRD